MSPNACPRSQRFVDFARDDRSGLIAADRHRTPNLRMATHGSLPPPNQPHPLRQLLSSLWTTEKPRAPGL